MSFEIRDENNRAVPGRGRLHVLNADIDEVVVESACGASGTLAFAYEASHTPRVLRFWPEPPGYWPVSVDVPPSGSVVQCQKLPSSPPPGSKNWWWHDALNIGALTANAGAGIKIGVIDTNLSKAKGLEHVDLVDPAGQPAAAAQAEPIPPHGEIVCRIIGQRTAPGVNPYGLAPGAALKSVVAVTPQGKLDLGKTTLAVNYLARTWGAHLINISAGRFDNPLLGLRNVIREATRHGTLCIVAAGNEAVDGIAYPARDPDCVGVGAIGLVGWGPESSTVRRYGELITQNGARATLANGRQIFHFPLSAWGDGLDLVAPGVGILVNRQAQSLQAATGTSYAAPMICGMLAAVLGADDDYVNLPQSRLRYERARKVLEGMCSPTGLAHHLEGRGLPRVPVAN